MVAAIACYWCAADCGDCWGALVNERLAGVAAREKRVDADWREEREAGWEGGVRQFRSGLRRAQAMPEAEA